MRTEDQEKLLDFGTGAAKNGIIFTSSKIISSIMNLALLIFLARFLQPSDFGLYALVVAFSLTLHASGAFGMGTALRRRLPQLNSKKAIFSFISNAFSLSLSITVAIVIFGICISGVLAIYIYHNPSITLPLEIGAIAVLFSVLYNLSIAVLTGIGRIHALSYSVLAYSIVQLFVSIILVEMGFGVMGAILGMLVGLISGFLIAFSFILKNIGFELVKPRLNIMKKLGKFSTPLVISNLSVNGSKSFAVLVLGVFASSFIVGEYNAAFRLGNFAEVIINSLAFMLLPEFSKALVHEKFSQKLSSIFNNSLYYTLLIMLPIIVYLISVAKPLILLFFSSEYYIAPTYFIVIIIGITLGIIGAYGSNIIIGFGDTKRTTKYQLTVILVELFLIVVLTPYLKAYGILIGMFIVGPLMLDIIYMLALKKSFKISLKYKQLSALVLSALILTVILFIPTFILHGKKLILINAILALVFYPIIVGLLHVVRKSNLEFISAVGQRIRISRILGPFIRYTSFFVKT
ncbi:MAG: oligosaccharide flippase family protein [Candidatus Micrarchaeia archaeon]